MMTSEEQTLLECNINKIMNHVKTLLNAILDGNKQQADAAFHSVMVDKVKIETDIRRVETARNIYDNAQKEAS